MIWVNVYNYILGILSESWFIFEEAAPYMFLGFGAAALIHIFVPDEKIMDYLGSSAGKFKSVLNASLAGIPLPLCSCGVIPTAISLKKRGATRGATLSFLISTPETGVDSIAITYALIDPIMTVFRPVVTFITALSAGITNNIFIKDEIPNFSNPSNESSNCACESCDLDKVNTEQKMSKRFIEGFRYSFVELLGDISKWLILGIIFAGVISYAVPDNWIQSYLGGGINSMLIMLIIGIPLYICASASTPLASALIAKGTSPGTAFVFLLAGPATNTATLTMVTRYLGKFTAIIYLMIIAICSLGFGLILDMIYFKLGIEAMAEVGKASEILPAEVKTFFAVLLVPIIVYGMYQEVNE
ncbi:permease [Methanohalobium evestigatum Z-7303]|uniref:Permease n=1 Tax=Methanohalobium evestigatum (strain ATCC BAA-1072 / DSM 3721 / NBRC 107634 / OCM 161 / Z-7303) TaxID=644295 RepID=D7EA23_METEZ|nr:SO_0444 family Cu/Zn efflux transporter [Methanohalobium evestigatum]ADI74694.1 permease [Methanohalobium evestigatum Z-7303]